MKSLTARLVTILGILFAAACSNHNDESNILTGKLTKVFPQSGGVERYVVLGSDHAFSTDNENIVKFNGVIAGRYGLHKNDTADSLYVLVPEGATSGPITVERNGQVLAGPVFTVIPTPDVNYFVQFKMGGTVQSYTNEDETTYVICGCVCYFSPSYDNTIFQLSLCDHNLGDLNSNGAIPSLKGKTFSMTNDGEEAKGVMTLTVGEQTLESREGSFKINDVVYDGSNAGTDSYSVSGTFSGTLYDKNTNAVYGEMTEGTFLVRLPVSPFSTLK